MLSVAFSGALSEHVLSGQLNPMLKGCDHEIVRALNNHPKAGVWTLDFFFLCGYGPSGVL